VPPLVLTGEHPLQEVEMQLIALPVLLEAFAKAVLRLSVLLGRILLLELLSALPAPPVRSAPSVQLLLQYAWMEATPMLMLHPVPRVPLGVSVKVV